MLVGSGYTPDRGAYALDLVRRSRAAARGAGPARSRRERDDGHRVQMRWRDLDGLGHVNHTVVLTYLEEGRDAFLERARDPPRRVRRRALLGQLPAARSTRPSRR